MQSRRGSCRETFNNSPAVRASTGGASSLNASGRLLARTTRSVISSSPRYRLRSGEASSSSTTLVSDIDTPPPPAACNKSGNLSRAGTGEGHRSLPSCEIKVQLRVASVGSLCVGTNLITRTGTGFCDTRFPGLVPFPGKIMLTPFPGRKQADTFLLRKPNRLFPEPARWARPAAASESIRMELGCNHAPFSVPKPEIQVGEHVPCAIETDDRMSGGGPQWCNLVEGRGCGR